MFRSSRSRAPRARCRAADEAARRCASSSLPSLVLRPGRLSDRRAPRLELPRPFPDLGLAEAERPRRASRCDVAARRLDCDDDLLRLLPLFLLLKLLFLPASRPRLAVRLGSLAPDGRDLDLCLGGGLLSDLPAFGRAAPAVVVDGRRFGWPLALLFASPAVAARDDDRLLWLLSLSPPMLSLIVRAGLLSGLSLPDDVFPDVEAVPSSSLAGPPSLLLPFLRKREGDGLASPRHAVAMPMVFLVFFVSDRETDDDERVRGEALLFLCICLLPAITMGDQIRLDKN